MSSKLIQNVRDKIWHILAIFIAGLMLFGFNMPIKFWTVFLLVLISYTTGGVLAFLVWRSKKGNKTYVRSNAE